MICTYEIGVKPELVEAVLKYKEAHTGVAYTNVGGWHSRYFYKRVDWFDEPLDAILNLLNQEYKFDSFWFNVNGKNNYNKWHAHSAKNKVAVYYVKTTDRCGNIEFMKGDGNVVSINPVAGQVLVFPGDLKHRVCENTSDEIRISAAINLKKLKI